MSYRDGICEQCRGPIGRNGVNSMYCFSCISERRKHWGKGSGKARMRRGPATPYKTLAQRYVSEAVKRGDLPRLDGSVACVDCSKPAEHYDHRDYKQPLAVDPVCRVCNFKRGAGASGHEFYLLPNKASAA